MALAEDWRVLRVQVARERDVEAILQRNGFDALTVCGRCERIPHGGRPVIVDRPLFPGYVFAHFDDSQLTPLLQSTPFTIGLLRFGSFGAFVPQHEIDRAVQISRRPDVISFSHLVIGQKVRIVRGPLAGFEGTLTELRGKLLACVNVPMLSRSVGAVVERSMLEPTFVATMLTRPSLTEPMFSTTSTVVSTGKPLFNGRPSLLTPARQS